ncbi:MAG: DNA polymerase III subunit delta [Phycisphaerales bacterium]|nr:DNA polymerase III subunit delta [Phycisphaerales bacterium]
MTKQGPDASHRIVVLHGKDSFLRLEWTHRLRAALEAKHTRVDEFSLDGATASLAAVLDELRSYGLIASHKLVIVENADVFFGSEDRRRAMERYAEAPMDEATLLLRSQNWRPGNFDKLVAKCGLVLKCDSPPDGDAARWCVGRAAKEHKIPVDPDAAVLLVERVGNELARLDSELAKLAVSALSVGSGSITRAIVVDLVGASRQEQAWEIQEAILSGDAGRAASKVTELLRISRAPEVMVAWAAIDLSRKIHAAAVLVRRGVSDAQITRDLRLWGESTGPILRAARTIGEEAAAELFHGAIHADFRMKTGGAPDPERLLVGLAALFAVAIRSNLASKR